MKNHSSNIVNAVFSHNPSSLALVDDHSSLTYGQLANEVMLLAEKIENFGNVGVMLKNSVAWAVVDLALIYKGLTNIPLADFLSDEQTKHVIIDAKINTIITDRPQKFADKNPEEFLIAEKIFYKISLSPPQNFAPKNIAKITYTSGTTSAPKGVCLTQESMEMVAQSLVATLGANLSNRHLCLLPFAVLLENVAGLYASLLSGSTSFVFDTSYDADSIVKVLQKSNAQSCILVPELLKLFLSLSYDFSNFSYIAVGGASVSEELMTEAKKLGLPLYQGYGLSESASVVSINTPQNNKIGSVGKVLPHIKLSISDEGEIILHKALFSGYLGSSNNETEPFPTGDIGWLDDDKYLHIIGRKKNILITSFGRNISPEWIESKLLAKSSILQVAVFGEARPFLTAVIVTQNPSLAARQIEEVNQTLPNYAILKSYVFASEAFLVKNHQLTSNGKLRRLSIFEKYQNQIELQYQKS